MTSDLPPLARLRSVGLAPSKKRGQHFLTDGNIRRKILDAVGASGRDVVVEIGAGLGALTHGLARDAARVYAVEVDRGLAGILSGDLRDVDNAEVLTADILEIDLAEISAREDGRRIKVVGNLPYGITAPVLLWIVRQAAVISEAFVMMQAEVAERITAGPGGPEYGPLTIAVQFWSQPSILFRVRRGSFSPPPGVDSAFVKLRLSRRPRVDVDEPDFFFAVVRTVFSQRRKMLKNSLLQLEGVNERVLKTLGARTGLDLNRRPQELSLEMFAELARGLGERG